MNVEEEWSAENHASAACCVPVSVLLLFVVTPGQLQASPADSFPLQHWHGDAVHSLLHVSHVMGAVSRHAAAGMERWRRNRGLELSSPSGCSAAAGSGGALQREPVEREIGRQEHPHITHC